MREDEGGVVTGKRGRKTPFQDRRIRFFFCVVKIEKDLHANRL